MAALQGKAIRHDSLNGDSVRSIGSEEVVTILARTWDAELLVSIDAEGRITRVWVGSPDSGKYLECSIVTTTGRKLKNIREESARMAERPYVPGVCEEDRRTVTPRAEYSKRRAAKVHAWREAHGWDAPRDEDA